MNADQLIRSFQAAYADRETKKELFYGNPDPVTSDARKLAYETAVVAWDEAWKALFSYGR